MANKRKPTKKRVPNQLTVPKKPDEDQATAIARTVLRPTVQAVVTLKEYGKSCGDLDLSGLLDFLNEQTKAVIDGDLKRGEAMLTAQAHTLDAIFNNLAFRAAKNMGEYMQACETYLKLALRAQSQWRATWEALATIKNPPMVGYVKQANIAQGHQQVNNIASSANDAPRVHCASSVNTCPDECIPVGLKKSLWPSVRLPVPGEGRVHLQYRITEPCSYTAHQD